MTSLADLLFDSDVAPDDPLVHWRDRTYSRGEIADAAQRLADTLLRMGAAPDSAVAALVPSTPLGLVMCFGIWRAGAVAAPIAPAPAPDGADADARPSLELPVDPGLEALVADVRPSVVVRPSLDDESLMPQLTVRPGEPRHYDAAVALIATVPDGGARPRRAQWTHDGVAAAVASAQGTLRDWAVHLVPVPLASGPGLDAALVAVATGGSVVLLDPCGPGDLAEAARRHGVRTAMVTADLAAALVDDPVLTTLAPLQHLRSVDRPLDAEETRRFRTRFGVTVLGGYGRTELGGEVVGWTVGDAEVHGDVKLGSVGRPYAGVELRIVRGDRTDAAPGESGEIWTRSPFVMRGYTSDRLDLGTRVDDRGFVHTGDRGRVDREGFLWFDRPAESADAVPPD